ncbi:MAG: tetratricopeptide repeat protein [Myxococcota bacterium]|nr:tetratricopeptide repeat protein [Myxococcota bacterium]
MTAAPLPNPAPEAPRWFFGPLPDLALGCGLLYFGLLGVQLLAGDTMANVFPARWLPILTLLLGAPHYGATLIRAYGDAESRHRYAFFGVVLTGLLGLVFLYGLRDHVFGSVVLTLYLTWSPWHYSAQNYGVGVAFLRRRGVGFDALTKRFLYGSFLLSYAMAFSSVHRAADHADYVPVQYKSTVYELIPLGIPAAVQEPLFIALVIAWLGATAFVVAQLLRNASLGRLAPVLVLLALQAFWFVAPSVAGQWGWLSGFHPFAPGNAAYTFMWVASGHFLQYLWITTYFAEKSSDYDGRARYLGRCLLFGSALWVVPALIFAPGLLGQLPYDFGLAAFTAATVNLHHFILDGAIWKFRDPKVTSVLVRGQREEGAERAWPGMAWVSRGFLVLGAIGFGVALYSFTQTVQMRRAVAAEDWPTVERAIGNLGRIGRTSPRHLNQLGVIATATGRPAVARERFEESLALHPTVDAYSGLAGLHERQGRRDDALPFLEAALALDDTDAGLWYRIGLAKLEGGEPEPALEALRRAAELAPERRLIQLKLEQAEEQLRSAAPAP